MIADFGDVLEFVKTKYREAQDGSEEILFIDEDVEELLLENARSKRGGFDVYAGAPSITDVPKYKVLKHATGRAAWAAVLAVDLRRSTQIAMEYGAEGTYVLMHTYIPTMAYLVEKAGGKIIGLRGDGLFAAFGIVDRDFDDDLFEHPTSSEAVRTAVRAGKAMIEAVQDAICPTLHDDGFDVDLQIGVAVDVGDFVITRIGLENANEVTAYGPPINRACKS